MSRRKQVKPQHINLEEAQEEEQTQQLAPKTADAASVVSAGRELGAPVNNPGTGEDMNGDQVRVRPCWEQSVICQKCCAVFFSGLEFLEHKQNCSKLRPVFIVKDSEGLVPTKDFRAVESYQPHNPSSKESPREHGGSSWDMKEKPGAESVLHSKKGALPPMSQHLSYLSKGKVPKTNVTLKALQGTKVAVSQQRASTLPAPLPGANSVPWFLEQVLYLQHQQLQQMQLTEQIRVRVSMWAAHTFHSGIAGVDTLKTFGSHMSHQVQGLFLDPLNQASLPYSNIPPTTSSVPQRLVPIAPRPDGSRVLLNHLPGAVIPQAPVSVPFQSPFSTVVLNSSTNGKERPSNVPPADVKSRDKAAACLYKCKHCSKSFGTNKDLQVHLLSHIEERPFVCSVCGQCFTTEDDLQEHHHQHFQVKANPQQFGEFHDKMATGIDVPCALSVPDPEDESSLSKSVLVIETPNVGLPQNISCGTNPKDLMGGSSADYPQPWPPESGDGYQFSGTGPDHNYPSVGGFKGRGASKPGSETLKLQQLMENDDKATTHPNECHICHRVLSSKRSLKVHYRTHNRESTYECKTCGRIFSTKGSLNTHLKTHKTKTSTKAKNSCPMCQKKFTNVVRLQQHIRMHTSGQIPSAPVLENPCDFRDPEPMEIDENGSTSATCHNDVESTDVDKVDSQDAPSNSSKIPMPLLSSHSTSPVPSFTISAILGVGPDPVVTQQQSSRGKGLEESGGLTNLSSVIGDQKYQSQNPDLLEVTSVQALTPVNSKAESIKSKFPDADGKTESSENSHTDVKGRSSLPLTVAGAQPTYDKVGPTTIFSGMASLLAAQPCQQDEQHGCTQFGKNSLASAVEIHECTHTWQKKPFMCNICRQAFTTKDNLQAHYMTHRANNSSAHCGRKEGIENTMVLAGTDGKMLPEMFPQETTVPSVTVTPAVCNQDTTMLSGSLASNTNKISVIQSVGIPTPPVSQGASSAVDDTTVSKIDGSQTAVSADVEKASAADSIPKHQSPHLPEAKLQESPPEGEM
ncbi:sal-like protein 4 isoform X1 [Pipistrellus kuhlii]|uniref:sal-like protein 4 isoform X1 n=1 Tax=Pipistrellus kuhlii TaxID=59472 RepID=UPI00174F7C49|nr:sal-like protein 4 isoform X1 [Pipistrellus kuhlii]